MEDLCHFHLLLPGCLWFKINAKSSNTNHSPFGPWLLILPAKFMTVNLPWTAPPQPNPTHHLISLRLTSRTLQFPGFPVHKLRSAGSTVQGTGAGQGTETTEWERQGLWLQVIPFLKDLRFKRQNQAWNKENGILGLVVQKSWEHRSHVYWEML